MLKLDWTKGSTYNGCERKYFYPYVLGLKPVKGATALRYGSVWHDTLEEFYSHILENGWTHDGGAVTAALEEANRSWEYETSLHEEWYDDYRTLNNLALSFMHYMDHFAGDEQILDVVAPAKAFQIPMEPVGQECKDFPDLKPFIFTGELDMIIKLSSRPWLWENKTTGAYLDQQIARLHRSGQFMGYTYAMTEADVKPDGMLCVYHHLSCYKSKKTQLYGKPRIDFRRVPQLYNDGDLFNWRQMFLGTAERVQHSKKLGHWPMQQANCYTYGRCTYATLCEQNAPLTEENTRGYYVTEPWDVLKKRKRKDDARKERKDGQLETQK